MKTTLKWAGRGLLAVVGLAVAGLVVIYAVSSWKMNRSYDVPVAEFSIPKDSASIAAGERLARIRGCYGGCHGEGAEGSHFVDDFLFGSVNAPDLTRVAASMSDGELARAVRHGIGSDGKSLMIMPSSSFYYLADDDLGAILAFLRSLPLEEGPGKSVRLGPLARLFLSMGTFEGAAAAIDHDAPRPGPGEGDPIQLGRYLAITSCSECHGMDFTGVNVGGFETPSLSMAQAYSPDEFRTLLAEGVPIGVRELGLMAVMAGTRFSLLTEDEVDAIHAFLLSEFGSAVESDD